jgi:hypothetical protein
MPFSASMLCGGSVYSLTIGISEKFKGKSWKSKEESQKFKGEE